MSARLLIKSVSDLSATTSGVLVLASTFDGISMRASYSGDSNGNNSAVMRFKQTGSGTWLTAFSPVADRRATISGQANPYVNQFRGSIVGLTAGMTYDVEVTIADADGVSGATTLAGTVSTIADTPPLGGQQWYVDDVGSNGNGSSGSPFNSIPNGIAAAASGDTIHIRPGSYPAFTIAKSGTSSGWIALVGDDRDTTFIQGAASNNVTVAADYVQIKNLRFKQSQHNSVEIASSRHHVWLDNLYHEDVSALQSYFDAGVQINEGSHHVYVLNNTILAPGLTALPPATPRYDTPGCGIHVSGAMGTEGTFVFKGNTINGGFRDGIGNAVEGFGGSTRDNTDIAQNTISGCKDDPIQMEGDDINLRIWGNVINADNGYSAIAMSSSYVGPVYVFRNVIRHTWADGAGSTFKVSNAVYTFYFHNTIENSGANHDAFAGASLGQVLLNNIIVAQANTLYYMGDSGGSSYDYNLHYRTPGGVLVSRWNGVAGEDYSTLIAFNSATGQEAHGVSGNPLFIDAAKHIDATSPAYNHGIEIPNFNDANSAWPYSGLAPDIGAYEV